MQLVQTLTRLALPLSVATLTVCRLGNQRRRVLLLAWLTLFPVEGFLPHKSHILDMVNSLILIQFRKSDYIPIIEKIGKAFSLATGAGLLTSLLLFLIANLLLLPISVQARETISVNRDTVIQANFLGVNAVYHGFTYLPESLEMGMTDKLRALELERVKESGIRIARSFYRPDWAMGDGQWLKPDWDSAKMKGLYAWLSDMQKSKVDVALNLGWWFPRDVIWNRDQHLPAYPDDLQNYCRWLSESLHQIVQVRGFTNVKYLVMFTEPADRQGDSPNGKKTWDYYKEVIKAVNQRLIDDGRRTLVQIVGPNTSQAPNWLDKATQELQDVIDIYSSHNYNFTSYQGWHDMALSIKTAVAQTGKPFWVDEYGVQDFGLRQSGHYGTVLALANAAFLNAGAQSSFLWTLNDQYYPSPLKYHTNGDSFLDGKHSWGLFPWLPESQAIRPAGQAFVLLARFMGQAGAKVLATKGVADLAVAAVEGDGGALNVLVVNGGKEPKEVTIDFSRALDRPLYRYAYRPEGSPFVQASRPAMPVQRAGESMQDALGAGEVVIYSNREPGRADCDPLPDVWCQTAEGIENLAFQKQADASSSDPDWPVSNLTDGKRLTSWRSAGNRQGQTEQVTIDLGQTFQVQQVELFPGLAADGRERIISSKATGIAVSTDKKKWSKIAIQETRPQAGGGVVASFPPQTARYVRIDSKGARQSPENRLFQAWLAEVKVFGR